MVFSNVKTPSSPVNDDVGESQTPPTISPSPAPSDTTSLPLHKLIFSIGIFIIVTSGMFYLIKLMIRKNRNKIKNRNLGGSGGRYHNGDGNDKRKSFIHFNGSDRLNSRKEKGMVEERKKVTAADHLKAIENKFNKISRSFCFNDNINIDEKERNGSRNFESEGEEELSDLESQDSYCSSSDSNNLNSDDSGKSTIRPMNNTLINHTTKLPQLPQPVYSSPSLISSPSSSISNNHDNNSNSNLITK